MPSKNSTRLTCLSLVFIAFAGPLSAQEVKQTYLPEGVTARVGGYRPVRAEMDADAEIARVAPMEIESPKFGIFEFGDKEFGFILDEPEEGEPKLYVDTNADGDFGNDPEAVWSQRPSGGMTMYYGNAKLDLGYDELATIQMYRFDPNDPRRAQLANTLIYYSDFGFEFEFKLARIFHPKTEGA